MSGRDIYRITFKNWVEWSEDDLFGLFAGHGRSCYMGEQVADPMAQPQSVPEPEFIASSVPTDEPTEAAPNVSEGKRALVVVTHQADDLYNVFYM